MDILQLLNFGVLLLFGVYISASFAGVVFNKRNILLLFIFSAVLCVMQAITYSNFGIQSTEKFYPLLTHFPLAVLLIFGYKRKVLSSIFSIMSAYLCCQLSQWISLLVQSIFKKEWVMYVTRIVAMLLLGVVIIRYVSGAVSLILSRSQKTVLIFGILPFVYYLFDYAMTVYTNLLYSCSQTIFEFLPFALCVAYLVFCTLYFKEYEEKCEIERYNQLMEIQAVQSKKELEAIRRSEYEISRLRHDMRHFLTNIQTFIQSGANKKAIDYINELLQAANQTALQKFCENDFVNMVLSYYKNRMNEQKIVFQSSVAIPKELPCSDTDFTSILANGLENAMQAVSLLDEEKRVIGLDLKMSENKLLLSVKNPYAHEPEIVDGMPITDIVGHGLGTQSIKYVAQKHNGNCQFIAKDGQFLLRVVL